MSGIAARAVAVAKAASAALSTPSAIDNLFFAARTAACACLSSRVAVSDSCFASRSFRSHSFNSSCASLTTVS